VHTAQRKQRSLDFCKSRSIFSHLEGVKEPRWRGKGIAQVNLALTEDQQFVRQTFFGLFHKEADPARVRASEPLGHDPQLWRHLIATGALGVGIPESAGGGGGGLLELALIAEEAGRRVAPIPLAEPAAAARLLAACDSQPLLDDALGGARIVSLATRPGPVERQILADGAIADVVIALQGDRLVTVQRPPDVHPTSNMGAMPLARWNDANVSGILVEGDRARALFSAALNEVRVLRAAALVGLASEAIEIGAGYARQREAFGIRIGTYQAVAHPLADALVAKDGAQLLTWKACWEIDEGIPAASSLAAMAYVFAAEMAYAATQHSLHIHGGYGFTAECDIQLYYRRAKAWVTAFADPERELDGIADGMYGPARATGRDKVNAVGAVG
jgi:alkylation response protein AidB-like acyl-CoA dehydrogenase